MTDYRLFTNMLVRDKTLEIIQDEEAALELKNKKDQEKSTSPISEGVDSILRRLKNYTTRYRPDTTEVQVFGLETTDGKIVKVTVHKEQAQAFERDLADVLASEDFSPEGEVDVAEILFNLKDKYDIVNVSWPRAEEEEESTTTQVAVPTTPEESDFEGETDEAGDFEDLPDDDTGHDIVDDEVENEDSGDEDVKSLLQQVINMMQADTAARTKEAEARAAEAEARAREVSAQELIAKVKQEEQILDMETDIKARKDADREAKRLAQLAKWKSDVAREEGEEEEELHIPIPDIPSVRKLVSKDNPQDREDEQSTASTQSRAKSLLNTLGKK